MAVFDRIWPFLTVIYRFNWPDSGDGDENEDEDKDKDEYKDEDKDEIPNYAVLLTTSVKIFAVSHMQDFLLFTTKYSSDKKNKKYIYII